MKQLKKNGVEIEKRRIGRKEKGRKRIDFLRDGSKIGYGTT